MATPTPTPSYRRPPPPVSGSLGGPGGARCVLSHARVDSKPPALPGESDCRHAQPSPALRNKGWGRTGAARCRGGAVATPEMNRSRLEAPPRSCRRGAAEHGVVRAAPPLPCWCTPTVTRPPVRTRCERAVHEKSSHRSPPTPYSRHRPTRWQWRCPQICDQLVRPAAKNKMRAQSPV